MTVKPKRPSERAVIGAVVAFLALGAIVAVVVVLMNNKGATKKASEKQGGGAAWDPKNRDWEKDFKSRVGTHEPQTNQKLYELAKALPENAVVVDAGAHVGDTGLVLASRLKQAGRADVTVVEVEPDQSKVDFISRKAREMGVEGQVKVVRAALWDKNANAELVKDGHAGQWKVKESGAGPVPLRRLDELVDRMDLWHLDVEGSELHALKGAHQLLAEFRPAVVMEVHMDDAASKYLMGTYGYKKVGALMERDQLFVG